jgi:diguanylate cyclase (GGDEF)-like protein/hemerythrin-like metal-binding protein
MTSDPQDAACPLAGDRISAGSLGMLLLNSDALAMAAIRRGLIVFANPAFHAVFEADELTGVPITDIVVAADDDRFVDALALARYQPVRYIGDGLRRDAPPFRLELCLTQGPLDGEPTVLAFAWDVTEQDKSGRQIAYLAYTDALTGLANRTLFADRLHQAVLMARRYGTLFAVLMLDLDGFKAINDGYGHEIGDLALQLVAHRFQGCIREGDTLARIGGDEFAVLLAGLSDPQAPALVAQRLIAALAGPLDLGAHCAGVGTSVGIAAWPEHGESAAELLAAADTAMYRAKRGGGNRFGWASRRSGAGASPLQPLAWSATHTVGIKEIDEQHEHLAGLVDRLSASLKDSLDPASVQASLNVLVHYAAFHFATEERLMEQYQVADLAPHRDEHRRLLHDLQNLRVDGDQPRISLILRYLQEWLLRHVDSLDRQLGETLRALGCR